MAVSSCGYAIIEAVDPSAWPSFGGDVLGLMRKIAVHLYNIIGSGPKGEQKTIAARGSAPPVDAGYDTPAGRASLTIDYNKPKPTAGAPPMWTDSLPDLWL